MTIRATKFTPEVLLSAPRRSAGQPNPDGSQVIYSVSTYDFAKHAKKNEHRLLDVKSQQTSLITDDQTAAEVKWLNELWIVVLFGGEDGTTTVKVGKADSFTNSSYAVGKVEGPVGSLKTVPLEGNEFAFTVAGQATPEGKLYNPTKAKKPLTSGRLYKSMFARHWDHWVTENRNALWLAKLIPTEGGKWELSPLINALKDTALASPVEPFGGGDHFDIGKYGLVFTAKDPSLNPALHTKTNMYFIRFDWVSMDTVPAPEQIQIYGFEGACSSPAFSPDGSSFIFLAMKHDGYESDKNQVFFVPSIHRTSWVIHAFASDDGKGKWDRSPGGIVWSRNYVGDATLYFIADDHGRNCLFTSKVSQLPTGPVPEMIVKGGGIGGVEALENGDLFISSSSLIDNSLYSFLPADRVAGRVYNLPDDTTPENSTSTTKCISSATKHGSMFGLSRRQIDEVHWPGSAHNTSVHAWVIKPSNFDSSKKYPLAYLIHGGPQGAWDDSWSTRWNPAVFAEQGYVVITPNPTGSTGYGQDFTDAIQGQWGGLPYQDLSLGFDWIRSNLSYVDVDRSVGLGASYGGYMMNWIQGHGLGRQMKALVTHDGVFSMTGQMASEELYFPIHDFDGTLWDKPDNWAKWDPSAHTDRWATPHLIIHSELDYRLTISEGLAAFHTLQSKGIESQFLTFDDENHWVLKPENSLLWHEVVLDWINDHVGLPKYSETRKKELEDGKNGQVSDV